MHLLRILVFIAGLLAHHFLLAQNYQAIHGSSYAGSLSAGNNPASIVHVPYAWDITPFSIQLKESTNAFTINNYSLLSSPKNITLTALNGIKKRFVFANEDIHLLNARFNLDAKSSIAFGINIRNYVHGTSSETNYQDTAYSLADFLSVNVNRLPLSAESAGSGWAEGYVTYARSIIDDGYRILNAGISLKLNRSLAGGYGRAEDIRYVPQIENSGRIGYLLTGGSLQYSYSANFDLIDSNRSTSANTKDFLKQTYTSLGADVGIEYIFLDNDDEHDEAADDYSYKTKIGISLMDIGINKYRHSDRGRIAIGSKAGITDTVLENKFNEVRNIDDFNDSLATVADYISGIQGDFVVYKPTRLVINVEQQVIPRFFINAELTLPVISLAGKNSVYIKDMSLLALTPRWETKSFGAYLPILMNIRNQVWVGGALRAGPLLLGTHNLANLFSKSSMQNGGFYLAFTIRPGRKYDRQHDKDDKRSKQERRSLQCPAL